MTELEIEKIIFEALESLNEEFDESRRIEINNNTKLFGINAALDSLSLVSVIVDVEMNVSTVLGRGIALTDDRAMSADPSPFTDVKALKNYILEITTENE